MPAPEKFKTTKEQEELILKNFDKMREEDICILAKISRFQLQKFKRQNNLFKNKGHRITKVVELENDGFFHYDKHCII